MCFPFCHKWLTKDYKEITIYEERYSPGDLPIAMRLIFVLQCEKCGDIKVKKYTK